ncbi:MAG: cytochrome b [Pseudomonadota bacterium]
MSLFNSSVRYGHANIVIHWLSALTVYGLFAVGFWMVGLDYYDPWYHNAPFYHKSVGILLLFLSLLRLFLRTSQPTPRPIAKNALEQKLALAVQWLFYALLFTILISGYLISTEKGQGISVFDWFTVPALVQGPYPDFISVGIIHEYSAYLIVGLSVLHIAAAIKHHFIEKDPTLKRMLKSHY